MKIAILGSWRERNRKKFGLKGTFDEYKEFCGKLGESLAKNNHEIIIGNYYEDIKKQEIIAEKSLVDSYLETLLNMKRRVEKKITVIHPYGEFKRFKHLEKEYPAYFDFMRKIKLKDWGSVHLEIAKRSDLMIIIGGGNLTNNAGYTCVNLKHFLIPIPNFGGAGKEQLELYQINREDEEKYDLLRQLLDYLNNQEIDGFIEALGDIDESILNESVTMSSIKKQIIEIHKIGSFNLTLNESFPGIVEKLKGIVKKILKIESKRINGNKLEEHELNLLSEAGTILEMIEIMKEAQVYKNALDKGRHKIYIKIDKWMKKHPKVKNFLKGIKLVSDFTSEILRPLGILAKILDNK